ncbi:hypothetical protein AB3X05_04070 [Acinetobacter baumannii]|uniref:hypothetical protein n=1 Tax=Acinetobacter baumannii TaxID=470 RepID=UPI001CB85027|nr:hypothetical protein [Acinetobacter baumannii]MDC5183166.1 hypothetical protein [Acinetobacter baumannii]MDC5239893.1 hypothetical protein [Acinetobacter baumannii]
MTMTNEQIEMEINNLKNQLTQKADVASVNTLANRVTNVETLTLVKAPQFQV